MTHRNKYCNCLHVVMFMTIIVVHASYLYCDNHILIACMFIIIAYDSSALSEVSSSGCGNGCGTDDEGMESSDEDLAPKEKRRKVGVSTDDDISNPKLQLRRSKRVSRRKGSAKKKESSRQKKAADKSGSNQDNGY